MGEQAISQNRGAYYITQPHQGQVQDQYRPQPQQQPHLQEQQQYSRNPNGEYYQSDQNVKPSVYIEQPMTTAYEQHQQYAPNASHQGQYYQQQNVTTAKHPSYPFSNQQGQVLNTARERSPQSDQNVYYSSAM